MKDQWLTRKWVWVAAGIAAGTTMVLGGVAVRGALAGHGARVRQDLTATSIEPNAKGKANLSLRSSKHGRFAVSARKLPAGKTYDLIVGGVKVGALQTSAGGSGRARFNTQPTSSQSLLGFDPQGQQVIIRDEEDGEDVLVGDLPDEDPAAVACCVADDDEGETECEDLTPDECAAANGQVQAVASCLPDPCASTPVDGEDIVCCTNATHDDESEAECEDVSTETECAALGGMVVQGASCDANPCAVTPPANSSACCVPHDGGTEPPECEVLSDEACRAAGGNPAAAASCEPDPCIA